MSNEETESDEDELTHVISAESETGSTTGSNTGEEVEEEVKKNAEEPKKKKKKSKIGKSISKLMKNSKDKVKITKGIDKIKNQAKEREKQKQFVKLKEIKTPTVKEQQLSIDKSKLRYSQTNLLKSNKTKVPCDMKSISNLLKAQESISNLLNRQQASKPLFKTTSFTAKEYVDTGSAQIETDQNVELKETKPVVRQRISPEKMTESLHRLVKHLYRNKQTLDVSQISKQDAKSTIKFTLSSFINDDGGARASS